MYNSAVRCSVVCETGLRNDGEVEISYAKWP